MTRTIQVPVTTSRQIRLLTDSVPIKGQVTPALT